MSAGTTLGRGALVLVTFPFSDLSGQKLRPGLIVGRRSGDDVIVAFVTRRAGSTDPRAEHLLQPADPEFRSTGLKFPSLVHLNKLATVHRRLIQRQIGRIGPRTESAVASALRYVFDL